MDRDPPFITLVSGLPRSRTSLTVPMLAAAGLPPFTERARPADEGNPPGYFECDRVKHFRTDRD